MGANGRRSSSNLRFAASSSASPWASRSRRGPRRRGLLDAVGEEVDLALHRRDLVLGRSDLAGVGLTGLSPGERLENHLRGHKAARAVTKYGVELVPKIQVLMSPGCGHGLRATELIAEIVRTYSLDAELETVMVESLEDATHLAFPGSPTVRVDGIDIEPQASAGVGLG